MDENEIWSKNTTKQNKNKQNKTKTRLENAVVDITARVSNAAATGQPYFVHLMTTLLTLEIAYLRQENMRANI